MYEQSIVPENWPGGGGFSVTQFTLCALYDMHERCRNWWTGSNVDLPLCRYQGVKLKLYQCNELDYVVRIQTELPNTSNKLTYPSCQPFMALMSESKIIVPSKKNERRSKPYKSVFISPPPQLQNKWYFQSDMFKIPLLTIHTSACSLDNTFLKPNQLSQCIHFQSLNTFLIQNRKMSIETRESWYYKQQGTLKYYFYFYDGALPNPDTGKIPLKDLIPLANIRQYKAGMSFNTHAGTLPSAQEFANNYPNYWGNPFYKDHLENQDLYYYSTRSPETIQNFFKQNATTNINKNWEDIDQSGYKTVLTKLDERLVYDLQYNPEKDSGKDTMAYLLQNSAGDGWDPPTNDKLILSGFPLWIIIWGFIDFQIKQKLYTNIDTNCILVLKSTFTQRPHPNPIVPISTSFTTGRSPYSSEVQYADLNKWYPQIQYQLEELNKIASTGPGTPFIDTYLGENITMFYKFKWKWGGSPPRAVNISDPSHQIIYPIPSNINETTSLQNPATPPESLLYSFDNRHGQFTRSAIERISQDWSTENFITSITDTERRLQLQKIFKELETSETQEEKAKQEIFNQLQQLRHQQQCLRQQIICTLKQPSL